MPIVHFLTSRSPLALAKDVPMVQRPAESRMIQQVRAYSSVGPKSLWAGHCAFGRRRPACAPAPAPRLPATAELATVCRVSQRSAAAVARTTGAGQHQIRIK